jgi:uncharacterized glyoxalase superfamily protein PhnB
MSEGQNRPAEAALTPHLCVAGPADAIDFYARAFAAWDGSRGADRREPG